jgi:hypothetical protein
MFFAGPDHRTWFAIAGVDVEVHPGTYPLTIDATLKDGTHHALHQDVKVEEAPYEKVPLTVPDKFVEPDAAALKKIAADKIVKDKAFANSAAQPVWSGNFRPPLHLAPQSDSFGNQRIFNGKLASVHRGLDYSAKMRTPVAAINSGRVVLAQPLYYEGGCVVIDHGLGLMSIYMPVEDQVTVITKFVAARSSHSAAPPDAPPVLISTSACAGRAVFRPRQTLSTPDAAGALKKADQHSQTIRKSFLGERLRWRLVLLHLRAEQLPQRSLYRSQ